MKDTTALTTEEISTLRIRERLKGLSDTEVVSLWYTAEDQWELTARQDEMRKRWDFAKAQFLKRKTFAQIRDAMIEQFTISAATAARDMRKALSVFGDLDKVPKEAHRQRAIEMALAAFKMAKKNKDADGMAKATRMYMTATGVDRDDLDAPDLEKLMKMRNYMLVLDPAVRELLLNVLNQAGGSIDVTKLYEQMYQAKEGEYIPYEDGDTNAVPNDGRPHSG